MEQTHGRPRKNVKSLVLLLGAGWRRDIKKGDDGGRFMVHGYLES